MNSVALWADFTPFRSYLPDDIKHLSVCCGCIDKCVLSFSVCLFFSLARAPGAAQYFASTVAPVGSGTVRIIITAPSFKPISVAKSPDAGSALHAGNEWMIVDGSHFTALSVKKKVFFGLFFPPYRHNRNLSDAPSHSTNGARGFDSIYAVGCCWDMLEHSWNINGKHSGLSWIIGL